MPPTALRKTTDLLTRFIRLESAGGLLLIGAAALALIFSNSPLQPLYTGLLELPVEVRVGTLHLAKPLLLWINDGLMAIFFLLVGLEIKREVLEGELSTPSSVVLPIVAALGGMAVPALIYVWLNRADANALDGWAIPTATDIAFALGVLSLLGKRVPISLKVFLTVVAIADDLGAIVIIAIFYTADLSAPMLIGGAAAIATLVVLNRLGVTHLGAYFLVALVLWVFVLKSGVHATLAGVVAAFAIPLTSRDADGDSPLHRVERNLHPWVAFAVLPIFAFANAGVSFAGMTPATLIEPLPLGIAAGLFIGKLVGVCSAAVVLTSLGYAKLPAAASPLQFVGVALLCGIGFTMSLFIGSLAFDDAPRLAAVRVGVMLGSLLSAAVGFVILRLASNRP